MLRSSLFLLAVLLLGASLRLPGLGAGLPQSKDADSVFVTQAVRMEDGLEPSRLYPLLLAQLLQAMPGRLDAAPLADAPRSEHLKAAARAHLTGRSLSALLSLLTLPAVFLLARSRMPAAWACLAATFAATSLLGVLLAHQARPHAALCAFLAWTLVFAERMARRPSLSNVLGTSLACGLALATLHSGVAAGFPVLCGAIIALRRDGRRLVPRLSLLLVGPALALLLAYPFLFTGELWGGRKIAGTLFDGTGFARIARTLWAFDPTLVILAGIGLLRRGRAIREDAVLAAFALPYLLVVGMYHWAWHRFSLPFVPILAVYSALGARDLARAVVPRPRWAVLVAVLVAAFPTLTAGRFAWLWTQPHSTELAAQWIEEHLDPREAVFLVSFGLDVPLPQTRKSIERTRRLMRSPWQAYQYRVGVGSGWNRFDSYIHPEHRADPSQIGVAEVQRLIRRNQVTHALAVVPAEGVRSQRDGTLQAIQEAGGRCLARFEPYRSDVLNGTEGTGQGDQLAWEPIAVAWRARGLGPLLEVWELQTQHGAPPQDR